MIASKMSQMSQHFWLSKRGSLTRLVINAPVKYAANFCIMYIFSAVNGWFELVFFYNYYCKYQL